ncbi:MAG: hypothetical protein GXY83_40960 [Rhodopirellula sp.]|nr:hypothetical protein [Rhodopirellula sp.]
MTEQELLAVFREARCFPHQAQFAAKFFAEGAAAYHLLITSLGMGKMYLASMIVDHAIEKDDAQRVLVLAPPSLCPSWCDMLRDKLTTEAVVPVSAAGFRELEAAVSVGQSPWPEKIVAVMSMDLVRQKAIAASLASVTWDLVIVDEAHKIISTRKTQRSELLQVFLESGAARRLLLMTAVPPEDSLLEERPTLGWTMLPDIETTRWNRTELSLSGTPRSASGSQWKIVSYRRSADEIIFHRKLQLVLQDVSSENMAAQMFCRLLQQRAASSVFAIEQSLQRLHREITSPPAWQEDQDGQSSFLEDPNAESGELTDVDFGQFPRDVEWDGVRAVATCLELLDKISTDEKLQTFLGLIQQLGAADKDGSPAICVISSFAHTVHYVHAAAQDRGLASLELTGSTEPEQKRATIDRFFIAGGLLIGTDSALVEGIDLPDVNCVIHYDLPASAKLMEARRGRFDRFGRTSPCLMYAFRDESNVIPDEGRLLREYAGEP